MLTLLRALQNVLESAEALMQKAQANAVPRKRPDPVEARRSVTTAPRERPSPIEAAAMRSVASVSGTPRHGKFLVVVARSAASLRLVLVGIVTVGFAFAYLTFTRDGSRQRVATKPAALTTGEIGKPLAHVATPPEGAPARASYNTAATPPPPTPKLADPTSIRATSLTSPSSSGPAVATVPAPFPRGTGATDRPDAAAIARGVDERYVPVVFTGKDQANVLQEFAKLQIRYPKLLSLRRAEAQPVDLGQKGTWHRLIVLPPSSHQSALDFCDQLQAAGYDRCWVKGY